MPYCLKITIPELNELVTFLRSFLTDIFLFLSFFFFLTLKLTRVNSRSDLLILILLEPNVINLCHHYRARPAFMSVQSDQALYCWLTSSSLLEITKMIMDSFKTGRWIIPFKKFSKLKTLPANVGNKCLIFLNKIKAMFCQK